MLNNPIPTGRDNVDLLTRLAQVDRQRGVELHAFDEGGWFRHGSELSLSEAARRIAEGRKVVLEEVLKGDATVTYSGGLFSRGVETREPVTPTKRVRTDLSESGQLEQFLRVRTGALPTTGLERLAARLAPFEGLCNSYNQQVESLIEVKAGLFGKRKLAAGPGLSAFAAAQVVAHGGTVALSQLSLLAMAQAQIEGRQVDQAREVTHLVTAAPDLDSAGLGRCPDQGYLWSVGSPGGLQAGSVAGELAGHQALSAGPAPVSQGISPTSKNQPFL